VRLALLSLVVTLVAASPAGSVGPAGGPAPPVPPTLLPGDPRAAHAGPADRGSWLVGAREHSQLGRLAKRHGATRLLRGVPAYTLPAAEAHGFVRALRVRGAYAWSEPNLPITRHAFPADPATPFQWALPALGLTGLTPPPPTFDDNSVAVIEEGYDPTHPEWQGARIRAIGPYLPGDAHGTAVASVAAAPHNGVGIVGAWPGADTIVSAYADGSCGEVARAIDRAAARGARVISMSYSFPRFCYTHFVATQYAFGESIVLVASAGNEGRVGLRTRLQPAGDPHVITVAATGPGDSSPPFSNANGAIDVAAPGEGVLAAVPLDADEDGVRDGHMAMDGTSFSAPLVAAGTAWVAALRDNLDAGQLTDIVRYSARDIGRRGWDPLFGFGAFDLAAALRTRPPQRDPYEPNEDVDWVNGARLDQPAVWRGRGGRAFAARLDQLEDPVDVYRFVQPRRSLVSVTVKPLSGDPDLEVYEGWARTVYGRRGRVGRSVRRRGLDRLVLHNRFRRRIPGYVVVSNSGRQLDAGYRLVMRRLR
jgi:Subtilase family